MNMVLLVSCVEYMLMITQHSKLFAMRRSVALLGLTLIVLELKLKVRDLGYNSPIFTL